MTKGEGVPAVPVPSARGGPRIASIGECMIELSAADLASGSRHLAFGGDTLNTAVYLARLGTTVDYVTALGDDIYSTRMLADWQSEGIGTNLVRRVPGRLPGLYTIELDEQGERSFFYWRDRAPAREIFADPHGPELCRALMSYDWLYLTGISLSLYGDDGRDRLFELLRQFRKKGGKVVFDDNYRPRGWSSVELARREFRRQLAESDIVLAGLDDERALHGVSGLEEATGLIHDAGSRVVIVKDGARGCMISSAGGRDVIPAAAADRIVDTTAAGDSFNAGFLSALLTGATLQAAARMGHACAAIVVGHRGAIVPKDAFLREMALRKSALAS